MDLKKTVHGKVGFYLDVSGVCPAGCQVDGGGCYNNFQEFLQAMNTAHKFMLSGEPCTAFHTGNDCNTSIIIKYVSVEFHQKVYTEADFYYDDDEIPMFDEDGEKIPIKENPVFPLTYFKSRSTDVILNCIHCPLEKDDREDIN